MHIFCCVGAGSDAPAISLPSVASSAIANYHVYLKIVYSASTVLSDKWPPTPSGKFISLAVVEGGICRDEYIGHTLEGDIQTILCERKEISVEQILEVDGQSMLRLVLVEGAPGIGKSTLAWELCRKWDEFACMKQYNLVVLLRLREEEVQKVESVSQLFYSYEAEDKEALVKEVLKVQGKGILFILDGFDELPRALQQKGFLLKLIKGTVLPACTILVTSRPSATADLLTNCRPQKRVEVLGFTQQSVHEYARSVFSSEPLKLEKFLAYISLSNNPAINSLMYVPLNAAIIVQIYQHCSNSSILPHTLTEMYTQLCLTVLNRYLKANPLEMNGHHVTANSLEDLPDLLHGHFLELSKIAFEGTKDEEVIFHAVRPELVHFGFLDSVSALYGGGRISYNFLHLTIQEFLAAYYISQLCSNGLEVFKLYGGDRWKVVWRFVAGLTKFEYLQGHIMNHHLFVEKSNEHKKRRLLHEKDDVVLINENFIQCLFEGQSFTYFHSASRPKPSKLCFCRSSFWEPCALDVYALGYCISNIPTGIDWEVIIDGEDTSDSCYEFVTRRFMQPFENKQTGANIIKKLNIGCFEVKLQNFKHLPLHGITELSLKECYISNTDLIHLSECIPILASLKILDLHGIDIDEDLDGFLMVLQKLSHINLTTLYIYDTGLCRLLQSDFRHESALALKSLIDSSNGGLQKLEAGDSEYDDDGTLASLLSCPSSLRVLRLHSYNLSLSHFEDTTLTTLQLGFWKARDDFERIMVKIVENNKTLQQIFANVGEKRPVFVATAIANALLEGRLVWNMYTSYS